MKATRKPQTTKNTTILAVDIGTTGMKMGVFRTVDDVLSPVSQFSQEYEVNIYNDGLFGAEDGDWFAEGIAGVLVGLWDNADMRVGYQFPLSRSQDLNNGFTGGLLWHFK